MKYTSSPKILITKTSQKKKKKTFFCVFICKFELHLLTRFFINTF